MVIAPGIETACDHLLGMIFEIMKNRDVRIARNLRPLATDLLKGPQVVGRHLVVSAIVIRAQQHTAHSVERDRAGDIGMARNKINKIARFGFRGWERTRAMLVTFGS